MSSTDDQRVGTTLDGRYLVDELVGVGAMGSVYRGKHIALGRPVAIKCMHQHLTVLSEMVQRFTAEARLGARLNHENIATVFDFGLCEGEHQSGAPLYIVMEFLAGPTLASTLPYMLFGVRQAADIQQQLLAALAHAHGAGIVHRDISPSNIVLEPRVTGETLKLIDFGVARSSAAAPLTEPGRIIGAPQYMSPEQVKGERATFCSDIYSAGLVFYEMLTGQRPFEADTIDEVLAMRANSKPLDPREMAPERGISEQVAAVCRRATAPLPEDRYATARVFGRALAVALEQTTGSAPPTPRAGRLSYPETSIRPSEFYPGIVSQRSSAADGHDFHVLLKLEKQAKAALAASDHESAIDIMLQGVRAASALYRAGQHEIGTSAAINFAKRACTELVAVGQYEEAKSVLGAVLQLLVRAEPGRAELLRLLSEFEQREARKE